MAQPHSTSVRVITSLSDSACRRVIVVTRPYTSHFYSGSREWTHIGPKPLCKSLISQSTRESHTGPEQRAIVCFGSLPHSLQPVSAKAVFPFLHDHS